MILIFGAGGQLGRELQRSAAAKALAYRAMAHGEADIADAEAVSRALRETRPALVVNAAGYTRVDLAESEVEAARRGQ